MIYIKHTSFIGSIRVRLPPSEQRLLRLLNASLDEPGKLCHLRTERPCKMPGRDQVRSSISIKPPLLDLPCLDHIVASQARSSSVCTTILIRDFTCNLFISSLASGDSGTCAACQASQKDAHRGGVVDLGAYRIWPFAY